MVNLTVWKVQDVDTGRDHEGEAADRRGARSRRYGARQAHQRAQRTGSDRTCARALHQGHPGRKDGRSEDAGDSNESSCSNAATRASACYGRKTSWRQAQLVDPGGSGPRPGNRQDAAGNRCRMQGSSPEPCWRRHRPAQAGWPHRRARRETLRHTVCRDGTTRRGLTPTKNGGREGSGMGDELNWPFKPDIGEVTDTGGMGVVAVAEHADIAASFQVSA